MNNTNSNEGFPSLPELPYTAKRWGQSQIQVWSEDAVRQAQRDGILADRAQRPSSDVAPAPVAGSVDTPEFATLAARYATTKAGKDYMAMVAHINALIAPAAPSGKPKAWLIDPGAGSARDAAMDEAVQILVAQQGWSDDDKPTVEMCVKLILISKHNPGLLPPTPKV